MWQFPDLLKNRNSRTFPWHARTWFFARLYTPNPNCHQSLSFVTNINNVLWRRETCLLWRRRTWNLTKQFKSPFQWQIVEIGQFYTLTCSSIFCHPQSFSPSATLNHSVTQCRLIPKSMLKWKKCPFLHVTSTQFFFLDTWLKPYQCSKLQWAFRSIELSNL